MLDGLTTEMGTRFLLAAGGVGLGLFVLVGILVFLRRRNSALFVRGGKAREPRLMVLDAAAVDARRRLVLIRRDDVEHLVMIGGPTDIVIESGIGTKPMADAAPVTRPATAIAETRIVQPEPIPARAAESRAAEVRTPAAQQIQPQRTIPETAQQVRPASRPAEAEPAALPQHAAAHPARTVETSPRNIPAREVSAAAQVLYGDAERPGQGIQRPIAAQASGGDHSGRAIEPVPARTVTPEPAGIVPSAERPLAASAEDILDAARGRVLQPLRSEAPTQSMTRSETSERIEPSFGPVHASLASQPIREPAVTPSVAGQIGRDELAAEFEKILDAEMAMNGILLQDDIVPVRAENQTAAPDSMPARQNPGQPPITGATPENNLEKEMARMLGEMSVKRQS